MNSAKWKKAAKSLSAETVLKLWHDYQKTHDPSVLVLGTPSSANELQLALISNTSEAEVNSAVLEYMPIGFLGIPNHEHEPTSSLLCLTPVQEVDPTFANHVLSDVAPQFTSMVDLPPSCGQTKAWYVDPILTSEMKNFTQGSFLEQYEERIEKWEEDGRMIRDLGYSTRPPGWNRVVFANVEIAQEIADTIEEQGLSVKFRAGTVN